MYWYTVRSTTCTSSDTSTGICIYTVHVLSVHVLSVHCRWLMVNAPLTHKHCNWTLSWSQLMWSVSNHNWHPVISYTGNSRMVNTTQHKGITFHRGQLMTQPYSYSHTWTPNLLNTLRVSVSVRICIYKWIIIIITESGTVLVIIITESGTVLVYIQLVLMVLHVSYKGWRACLKQAFPLSWPVICRGTYVELPRYMYSKNTVIQMRT